MTQGLLPTTVVGSYPQPDWLIDRDRLTHLPPVRVRAQELWRIAGPWLEEAQDDATRLAIGDMEQAGIDIITDGEIRRESYSNRFATALSGVDLDNPATVRGRSSGTVVVPRIVGPIRRLHPVEMRDVEFLRRHTDRTIKITLPGPFTMSRQAKNEYYKDEEELVMDYAAAVNAEVRDLKAAGADVIQLDEPWLQARPEEARRLALPAIERALDGIAGPTALHLCFWLRLCLARQAERLFVFVGTGRDEGRPNLDRGGATRSRPRRSRWSRRQDGDFRRRQHGRPATGNGANRRPPHPRRPRARAAGAVDPGPRLRHEIPAARHRLCQVEGARRRCRHRPPRANRRLDHMSA
jgi:methionine synthase II (cobalamin-independent)